MLKGVIHKQYGQGRALPNAAWIGQIEFSDCNIGFCPQFFLTMKSLAILRGQILGMAMTYFGEQHCRTTSGG